MATPPKHCGRPMEARTDGAVTVYRCRCGVTTTKKR